METIKILVVDDEQSVLNAIKNILSDYTIFTETNAFQAMETLKKENPDIFIIDYQMPVVDGIELLEEIQETYTHKLYIGILATASGTTYLFRDEQANNVFTFFLEKPIDAVKLKKLIQKSIDLLNKAVCVQIADQNIFN